MKLAVLADIHGNLEAFESVLSDLETLGVTAMVSLGDNVGYGPDSEAVLRRLSTRGVDSVLGNHELVIKHPRFERWFNPLLRKHLHKTKAALSLNSIDAIMGMEKAMVRFGARFVHGFPPASPVLYLFQMSAGKILRAFSRFPERICFLGHTHDLRLIVFDGARLEMSPLKFGVTRLRSDCRYMVNVGSVGQPRDGDNRAKYVLWDIAEDALELRAVPYDIETVVKKIRKAGFPESYGTRLR